MSGSSTTLLALLPSLGTTTRTWERAAALISAARPTVEVAAFDLPGHGQGQRASGFEIAELAVELAEKLDGRREGRRVVIAGVSMGGAIALDIARSEPDWLAGVALFNSAAHFGTADGWRSLIEGVRRDGLVASQRQPSAEGWFTADFRRTNPELVAEILSDLDHIDVDSYVACCHALARYDERASLSSIRVPLLAVAGSEDAGPTPSAVRELADAVPGARFEILHPAAHVSIVEQATTSAALLIAFLDRVGSR